MSKLSLPTVVEFTDSFLQQILDQLSSWANGNVGLGTNLSKWPMTFFELNSTGYNAAPDKSFRNFQNGTTKTDIHNTSSSWITDAANGRFKFPTAGTYLISMGKRLPNAEAGTAGLFLLDETVANYVDQIGLRIALNAGTDPSANIVRSGATAGVTLYAPIIADTYRFGGYYDGSGNFSVWFVAIQVPF